MNYNKGNFIRGEIIVVLEYIKKYKEELRKCFKDLKRKNTFYKQIPNILTFSRAALSPISSALFLTGHPVVGVIFTGGLLLTDLFDGKLARRWDAQSKFGADLDAFCDKIMFLWLALPLIISNPIVLLNFIFEGAISWVNVFGRMKGLNTKTVFSGKVKTCFLSLMLISGYFVQFLDLNVSVLNTLVGITLVSQGIAFGNYIKEYKRLSNEKKLSELKDLNNCDDSCLEQEKTIDKDESLTDSLRKERDFVLGFNEPDKEFGPNIRNKKYGK